MTLAPHVLHLVRTACLVESRAHQYSGYLASVFAHRGWTSTFDQWGVEEETHGTRLRAWLEKEDPTFDFERSMGRYLATVPYHAEEGGSVYGSEQGELVARCFVEAMAATYYQAVGGGAVGCASLQALCRGLAADEARHYTMFRRLLERIRREEGIRRVEAVRVVMQRMLALQDEQIVFASFVAGGGAGRFELEKEGRRYRAMMLSLYRPEHVRFVGTLVAQVLEVPRPPKWVDSFVGGALRLAPLPDPLP